MSNIVVQAPRVRKGRPVTSEIVTRYVDDGRGLPILVILSDWSEGPHQYRSKSTFHVEEIVTGMDGRAFLLHRSAEAIAADGPEADERYGVFVARNLQDGLCECRGFSRFGYCKHHDALRGLIEAGHIDEPGADRTPAPVNAEAVLYAPY